MYAITAGLVTCCWPGCSQPGTVTVRRHGVVELPKRGGGTVIDEHEYDVDYCARHAGNYLQSAGNNLCGPTAAPHQGETRPTRDPASPPA